MRLFISLFFLFTLSSLHSQTLSAEELLNRSIAFHDPSGQWDMTDIEMVLSMESPSRPSRASKVNISNQRGTFKLSYVNRGHLISYEVDANDSAAVYADFELATNRKDIDSLDLSTQRAKRWRDYYTYLYGMPMKLKDEGTQLNEDSWSDTFNGEEVLAMRVTYAAEVGQDVWYFYFNPDTYALVGYRFYHDESLNDGEYVVLDGIEIQGGLRIPQHRYWYMNEDARFLGADMMRSLEVKKP